MESPAYIENRTCTTCGRFDNLCQCERVVNVFADCICKGAMFELASCPFHGDPS